MTKKTFEFTGAVELIYDENSAEFQEALASFREDDAHASVDAMLKYVAQNLSDWGDHEHMIEGVGYVGLVGSEVPKKSYSGIQVVADYDERDFN